MCRTSTWWPRCRRKRSALRASVAVEQEIGDEHDEAAPAELVHHPPERGLGRGALPGLERAERAEQLAPVAEPRARAAATVRTSSSKVMRPVASRWRSSTSASAAISRCGVGELGEHGVSGSPVQAIERLASQHHHGAEVGLLLELLHVEPVVAAQDLPVDVAQLVARLVHPVLGELDGESAAGRAVQAGEKAFDDAFGDHFEPAELGDLEGVEQVEPGAGRGRCGAIHAAFNRRGVGGAEAIQVGPVAPHRRRPRGPTVPPGGRFGRTCPPHQSPTLYPHPSYAGTGVAHHLLPTTDTPETVRRVHARHPGMADARRPPASSPHDHRHHPPAAHRPAAGRVTVWSDRDEPYRRGEGARVYISVDEPSYVTVFRVDTDGRLRVLFPREPWTDTYVRGQDELEVTGSRGGRSFLVDDDPGVGYLFAIASGEPFDFRDITRGDYWDYRLIDGGRIQGDPYVRLTDLAARIAPDGDYDYDIAPYYVDRHYDYPRFVCYDCHAYASYNEWDPYRASCTRYRVVVRDDPRFYPYRYGGRNVVADRPAHPGPRFVFRDADPRSSRAEPAASPSRRRGDDDPGRTSEDVGGRGSVPAPRLPSLRTRDREPTPELSPARPLSTSGAGWSGGGSRRRERDDSAGESPEGLRPATRRRRAPASRSCAAAAPESGHSAILPRMRISLVLGLALAAGPLRAQTAPPRDRAAATITAADVARHIGVIADDSMLGRDTPSRGLELTARYVADQFRRFGLRPGGDRGGWFQRYPITRRQFDPAASRVVLASGGTEAIARFDRAARYVQGAVPAAPLTRPGGARGRHARPRRREPDGAPRPDRGLRSRRRAPADRARHPGDARAPARGAEGGAAGLRPRARDLRRPGFPASCPRGRRSTSGSSSPPFLEVNEAAVAPALRGRGRGSRSHAGGHRAGLPGAAGAHGRGSSSRTRCSRRSPRRTPSASSRAATPSSSTSTWSSRRTWTTSASRRASRTASTTAPTTTRRARWA